MPRIKRWFPVSHDINADGEVWAMRHQIGEKSLSIWLEILSISDRNESELPGDYEELVKAIAGRCQAAKKTVLAVFEFAKSRMWLTCEPTLRVSNYAKYHTTRDAKEIPSGISKASPPSEPSEPSEPTRPYKKKNKTPYSPPKGDDADFNSFWSEYPKKIGKGAALKAWNKIRPNNGTRTRILEAVRKQATWGQWTKEAGRYIPNPATWLNQQRWEDEEVPDIERMDRKETPADKLTQRIRETLVRGLSEEEKKEVMRKHGWNE